MFQLIQSLEEISLTLETAPKLTLLHLDHIKGSLYLEKSLPTQDRSDNNHIKSKYNTKAV